MTDWALVPTLAMAGITVECIIRRRVPARIRFPLLLVIAQFAYVLVVGSDVLGYSRYFVLVMPLMAVLTVGALSRLFAQRWRWARVLVACALVVVVVQPVFGLRRTHVTDLSLSAADKLDDSKDRLCPLCDFFESRTPRGTPIALYAAGRISYFSGLPVIDLIGLNDPDIARAPRQTGTGFFDIEYKRALDLWLPQRPAFVDTRLDPGDWVRGKISSVAQQDKDLAESPKFTKVYAWLRSVGGRRIGGVWLVRRDLAKHCVDAPPVVLPACDE